MNECLLHRLLTSRDFEIALDPTNNEFRLFISSLKEEVYEYIFLFGLRVIAFGLADADEAVEDLLDRQRHLCFLLGEKGVHSLLRSLGVLSHLSQIADFVDLVTHLFLGHAATARH